MLGDRIQSTFPWFRVDSDAVVVSTTRKWANLLKKDGSQVRIEDYQVADDLCVGDFVTLEGTPTDLSIASILPKKTVLMRQLGKRSKAMASNLDRLLVLCDGEKLFQPYLIDRMLVASEASSITPTLVVNKVDLPMLPMVSDSLSYYCSLYSTIHISAKTGEGLDQLTSSILDSKNGQLVALAGPSGVGKSSLLNALSPSSMQRVGELSTTGQGRQTTSQSFAVPIDTHQLLLIDLPGVQQFGIQHLSITQLKSSMRDIDQFAVDCEYRDCNHIAEQNCGVKQALESNELLASRYQSYLEMFEEITKKQTY